MLRGDDGEIHIGARTSIQDGCVLHCAPELPTVVGDECVIGHMVHLEGCTIEDGSLVGNGAVVLHGAVVRTGALVGSNAVVTNGMEVPSGHMALGIPAKLRPGGDDLEAGIRDGDAELRGPGPALPRRAAPDRLIRPTLRRWPS